MVLERMWLFSFGEKFLATSIFLGSVVAILPVEKSTSCIVTQSRMPPRRINAGEREADLIVLNGVRDVVDFPARRERLIAQLEAAATEDQRQRLRGRIDGLDATIANFAARLTTIGRRVQWEREGFVTAAAIENVPQPFGGELGLERAQHLFDRIFPGYEFRAEPDELAAAEDILRDVKDRKC